MCEVISHGLPSHVFWLALGKVGLNCGGCCVLHAADLLLIGDLPCLVLSK